MNPNQNRYPVAYTGPNFYFTGNPRVDIHIYGSVGYMDGGQPLQQQPSQPAQGQLQLAPSSQVPASQPAGMPMPQDKDNANQSPTPLEPFEPFVRAFFPDPEHARPEDHLSATMYGPIPSPMHEHFFGPSTPSTADNPAPTTSGSPIAGTSTASSVGANRPVTRSIARTKSV